VCCYFITLHFVTNGTFELAIIWCQRGSMVLEMLLDREMACGSFGTLSSCVLYVCLIIVLRGILGFTDFNMIHTNSCNIQFSSTWKEHYFLIPISNFQRNQWLHAIVNFHLVTRNGLMMKLLLRCRCLAKKVRVLCIPSCKYHNYTLHRLFRNGLCHKKMQL
jgi:hypothetical protein